MLRMQNHDKMSEKRMEKLKFENKNGKSVCKYGESAKPWIMHEIPAHKIFVVAGLFVNKDITPLPKIRRASYFFSGIFVFKLRLIFGHFQFR